jgi:hypothetical protein
MLRNALSQGCASSRYLPLGESNQARQAGYLKLFKHYLFEKSITEIREVTIKPTFRTPWHSIDT